MFTGLREIDQSVADVIEMIGENEELPGQRALKEVVEFSVECRVGGDEQGEDPERDAGGAADARTRKPRGA